MDVPRHLVGTPVIPQQIVTVSPGFDAEVRRFTKKCGFRPEFEAISFHFSQVGGARLKRPGATWFPTFNAVLSKAFIENNNKTEKGTFLCFQ